MALHLFGEHGQHSWFVRNISHTVQSGLRKLRNIKHKMKPCSGTNTDIGHEPASKLCEPRAWCLRHGRDTLDHPDSMPCQQSEVGKTHAHIIARRLRLRAVLSAGWGTRQLSSTIQTKDVHRKAFVLMAFRTPGFVESEHASRLAGSRKSAGTWGAAFFVHFDWLGFGAVCFSW